MVRSLSTLSSLSVWSYFPTEKLPPKLKKKKKSTLNFILFFHYLFIYLFLAALGLRCCVWAFSSCGERGLFFVVVHGLLIAVASLVAEHGL